MKNFSKMAVMAICLLLTAIFTSACGGSSSKTTPTDNSALYFLLAQQNNQQQQEENNNEGQNNQEQNNEEESAVTSEVVLTLTDSLQSDKIAFADIYYSVESTAKSSADDQEILKAEPTANDKTKFTLKVPDGIDFTKAKIKAVLTYDSEENLLDYFSSYDGVEATSGSFDVDFGNSKDNEAGFADGNGEDKPYIISAPRHFVNINKKDDQGNYLYLDKSFKQTANLDFTHLVGFKVNKADNDKEITGEIANKKAPFYNEGKGITKIGGEADYQAQTTEEVYKNCFKGTYDGDSHTIDGIIFVNPKIAKISLFNELYGGTIKNLTIGENSIVLIDENNEIYSENLYVCMLSIYLKNSTVENCTNNAKIIIKNVESIGIGIVGLAESYYDVIFKNCTNNGNITIDKCKVTNKGLFITGIGNNSKTSENCTNNGNITLTNSNSTYTEITGLFISSENITSCVNKGNIEVSDNTIIGIENSYYPSFNVFGIARDIYGTGTNCTNERNITIKNNTTTQQINVHISGIVDGISGSMTGFVNNGNITIDENSDNYVITAKQLNIDGSGTISNCTENGTITINGVVQP